MGISQTDVDALFGVGSTSTGDDAQAPTPDSLQPEAKPVPAQPVSPEAILKRILTLAVPVSASLAEKSMKIDSILEIEVGTIVEFDVLFDAELTLYAVDQPIGKGHAVKIGENFGLRVTRITPVHERIGALGGHSHQG